MSEQEGDEPAGGAEPAGSAEPAGGERARAREGSLARVRQALAEREVPVPQLEGYPLHKARKILALAGLDPARLALKLVEDPAPAGRVVGQYPSPGQRIDRAPGGPPIELQVASHSPLGFLPQIYQRSDFTGRNFVRDLLWVMQHVQFQTHEKLDHLERYFDPHEAPPEFLEYLASWVALTMEDDWPEAKRRSLIKRAVELYHLRGTARGLRVYLRIFTGVDPVIVENVWPFPGLVVGQTSTVGEDTVLMHRVDTAHTFVVHVPLPLDEVEEGTIRRIHRIIEREKPVHADYYLTFATREEEEEGVGITVGVSSTVGVDTWIKGQPEDGQAAGATEPGGAGE